MPNSDLHWLTIADAARLIERRRLSPIELTDALTAHRDPGSPAQCFPNAVTACRRGSAPVAPGRERR
jgi:hypothetical protein